MGRLEEIVTELEGRFLETGGYVRTVREAAERVGVSPRRIIKSLVVITDSGPILAILDGESRLDLRALGRGARLATPEEVKAITGYEVGEVPPVGIELPTVVDEAVLEHETVIGGGGTKTRLVELDPRKIVEFQRAEVRRIRV